MKQENEFALPAFWSVRGCSERREYLVSINKHFLGYDNTKLYFIDENNAWTYFNDDSHYNLKYKEITFEQFKKIVLYDVKEYWREYWREYWQEQWETLTKEVNECLNKYKDTSITLKSGVKLSEDDIVEVKEKYSTPNLDGILYDVMDLGMTLRQNQLNGRDDRSGNEVLEEWKKINLK